MLKPPAPQDPGTVVDGAVRWCFGRLREDGVFAPRQDRFSPANTAAALVALTLAGDPGGDEEPEGVVGRGITRLLAAQRANGGWAMAGVPTEPLTTRVVTAALRAAAPHRSAAAVGAGRQAVERLGGTAALPDAVTRGLARQFDALAGFEDEAALPRLPLELLLARGVARRLLSLRLPVFAALALGQGAHRRRGPVGRRLEAAARPAALGIVREAFERDGGSGEFSTDPWLTALICVGVTRSGLAPDIASASAAALRRAAGPDGGWDLMPLDITWTTFALNALLEAGDAADPALRPAAGMLRERRQDRAFGALACPPGHWGFSSATSWPMALETAEAVALLSRLPGDGGGDGSGAREGVGWLTGTQDRRGSWSLAVRNSRPGGFGPCPQMTAKAVLGLLASGVAARDRRIVRALAWLAGRQRPDGTFEALWYRGGTAGTAAVLEAFCAAGRGADRVALAARRALEAARGPDGSWDGGAGGGGTVEDTAWALHALLVAGAGPHDPAVAAGARWLADRRRPDGGWAGAPVNEYIRSAYRYADEVIASGLALRALARLRREGAADGGAGRDGAASRGGRA